MFFTPLPFPPRPPLSPPHLKTHKAPNTTVERSRDFAADPADEPLVNALSIAFSVTGGGQGYNMPILRRCSLTVSPRQWGEKMYSAGTSKTSIAAPLKKGGKSMQKLKVATVACGLIIGLAGVAHGQLSSSYEYTFTGHVSGFNKIDNINNGDDFKAVIDTDSNGLIAKILLLDIEDTNNIIELRSITNVNQSYIKPDPTATSTSFNLQYENTGVETFNISYGSDYGFTFDFQKNGTGVSASLNNYTSTPTPIPAAAWLMASGLLGMVGLKRKKNNEA